MFTTIPYALQNGSLSADLLRQATSSLVPPGGGLVTAGDFTVTQTGTPSMGVSIGVGRIWIPGTNVGNVTGGNFSSQAMYYGQNDAAYTASVATSDPINPRIDVVYAAVKDSQYSGVLDNGTLATVAGVATSGATYPTNAPTIPANAKAIAYITVPAGATSILNANITPILMPSINPLPWMHSEWTYNNGGGTIPSATVWGTGVMSIDAAQSTDTGFVTYPAFDSLTLRDAGEYAVSLTGVATTVATGRSWLEIWDGTNFYARTPFNTGENGASVSIPNLRLAANTTIKFAIFLTSGATFSFSGRVRITRVR